MALGTDIGDSSLLAGYYDIEQRRIGTGGAIPTILATEVPATFPMDNWTYQAQRYYSYWSYFTGNVWREEMPDARDENNNPVLKYPLQINLIKTSALKHSYVLFGEASENPVPLVPIRVKPRKPPGKPIKDTDKDLAEEAEDFVNRVWMDNNGRSLMQENGALQQFLGGCVFRVNFAPDDDELEYGIRIENILPDFFLPVWDNGRPTHLLEAWVVYRIAPREAYLRFGMDTTTAGTGQYPLYVEHWTKDKISITIGGKPITYIVNGNPIRYDNVDNPFGFIPFVYIPRERVGSFYGISLVDDLQGIAKEHNARLADIGDLIRDNAHRDIFLRNIAGAIKPRDIGIARAALDLGLTPNINKDQPDVFTLDPVTISPAIMDYPDNLMEQFNFDSFTPNVAYGVDEGSQRSALTLSFRMWPITSKIRAIRTNWDDGLIAMAKMIIRIAIVKKIGGMTDNHWKKLDFIPDWAPMIPRDREQMVDETVAAVQVGLVSAETAIARLDLVDDPLEEIKRIKADKQWVSDMQTEADAKGAALKNPKISPPSKALGAAGAPYTAVE